VPQIVAVYQQSRQTLPFLTRALIASSDFLRATGWYWLSAIALAAIGAVLLLARRRYRTPTLAFVVSPFVVLALLGLLLNVDTALAPLR